MKAVMVVVGLIVLVISVPAGAQGWGECAEISGNLVGGELPVELQAFTVK